MSRSRLGTPCIIRETGGKWLTTPLKRLQFRERDSQIDENWLQELIDREPGILPVGELYSRLEGRMLSLGREIPVPSGFIDNLLLTESGHLVVVETKLWRNPQARREVVAQLLDYASHVRNWHYEKLEELWRARDHAESLYEAMAPQDSEKDWVDTVNRQLEAGEMLLLVVGDGIGSRAEALAEVIGQHGRPDMRFRLALVELRIYRLGENEFLVVPDTLARTVEIERATVRIVYEGKERPEVRVDPIQGSPGRSRGRSRSTLDAQALIAELESGGAEGARRAAVVRELLRQLDERAGELVVDWKSAGFAVKTPDPVSDGNMLSLAVVSRADGFYAYWGWIREQIARSWEDEAAAQRIGEALAELVESFGQARRSWKGYMVTVDLAELAGREREVVQKLAEFAAFIRREAQKYGG